MEDRPHLLANELESIAFWARRHNRPGPGPQQRYNALAIDVYAGNASSQCFFPFRIRLQAPSRPPHVPPCSASLRRCIVWVYLAATLKHTATKGSVVAMVATAVARLCRTLVGMVSMVGNESVTVRLPDQCSADPTLDESQHPSSALLLPVSCSVWRQVADVAPHYSRRDLACAI